MVHASAPALPAGTAPYTSSYLHHDQIGSVIVITNNDGVVVATGALSGFASTGTLKGALKGAFTAGIMFGVGEIGNALKDAGYNMASGGIGKIALHAGAGCLSSVAGGGSCKAGAISGALGEIGTHLPGSDNVVLGIAKSATLGGLR